MAYADVEFGYREQVPSSKLNQLAENTRVANDFATERRALPHMRVRHTGGNPVGDAATYGWVTMPMNTTPTDRNGSNTADFPGTIGALSVTLATTGLYLVTAVTTLTATAPGQGSDYSVRIINSLPEPDVVLAQSQQGSGPSQTQTLHFSRLLTAGTVLQWQVYTPLARAIVIDAAATPCYLDIIRLSD